MNKLLLCVLILFAESLYSTSAATQLPGASLSATFHGWSVDVEGEVAVVGAPLGWVSVGDGSDRAGAVYVYRQQTGEWTLEQVLNPTDLAAGDQFGDSVRIHQGRIVVSAPYHDPVINNVVTEDAGVVYVFEYRNSEWTQTSQIIRPNAKANDWFGKQLTVGVDRIFISALELGMPADQQRGAIHVYDLVAGEWTETAVIRNDLPYETGGLLGSWPMSYHQGQLAAAVNTFQMDQYTGYVHVYTEEQDNWMLQQVISSPDGMPGDFFGASVSVFSDHLLVGASAETGSNGESQAGAAYVFQKIGEQWSLSQKLTARVADESDNFGIEVVMADEQLIIGQRHTGTDENNINGQVYVYNQEDSGWQLVRVIKADTDTNHDDFGQALGLDHDRLVVGAPFSSSRQGMAYVYDIQPNAERFTLNEGLNGNWYNLETQGQGLFFDVRPEHDYAYAGWFTYDTMPVSAGGDIGDAGHRWLVGNGLINQSTQSISFDLLYAAGGLFDNNQAVIGPAVNPYGSMTVVFDGCDQAQVSYQIPSQNLSGQFTINRPVNSGSAVCQDFASGSLDQSPDVFDQRLTGHWYNPDTSGQGMFIDQFYGTDAAFLGWFTFDTMDAADTPAAQVGANGQRWLVGAGQVDDMNPAVLNYQLYYTSGGYFDDPAEVSLEGANGYGTLRIEFLDCAHAAVSYEVPAVGVAGQFEMIRLFTQASELCPDIR
ncbi:hypothetical protein ACFODZ_11300 [Marinicella sediminis]|uniref:FG-GAP repeat protein n=1 Tax=Marinicella sediminis TaxID=1792834 RepID=A0ABV7J9P0_9GAMM|nr:hypothetical protein [Marinicella sediminis]